MNITRKALDRMTGGFRFLRTYGHHLPMALDALFNVRCTVTKVRGSMSDDGAKLTAVLVGRSRRNRSYLTDLLFQRCEVLEEVRTTLISFRKPLQHLSQGADVVIADVGWPYHAFLNRSGGFLEIPDWVNMSIELRDEWSDVIRQFRHTTRNNDLRLIRRNEYRYLATSDPLAIADFYDRLYVPFVARRHDAASILAPRRHVIRRARAGALLQILRGDELVAAGVVYPEDGALYFLWMGIPPEHIENPPEAAISALYFFGIQYAFEQHFDVVDFTGTRPFLNDGSFRFKRKWGAIVEDTFSPSSILIKIQAGSADAATFCRQNPLLARRDGGLEALFLVSGEAVDLQKFLQLDREFGCEGIDRITVIEISDQNTMRSLSDSPAGRQYRHIQSRPETFSIHYARRAVAPP